MKNDSNTSLIVVLLLISVVYFVLVTFGMLFLADYAKQSENNAAELCNADGGTWVPPSNSGICLRK